MYMMLICCCSVFLTVAGAMATAEQKGLDKTETVTIDFGSNEGPAIQRAAGILHSLTPDKPADEYVLPLKIRTLRMKPYPTSSAAGASQNCPRAKIMGAEIMLLLSDRTGYGAHGWWPGDDGDWTRWEDTVRSQVTQALETDCDYVFDIWNEPDIPPFWNPEGSKEEKVERFFETWRRAYRVIRELAPDAAIVGPSNAYFDYPQRSMFRLEEFLIFARDNDVLPDILSWHEGWKPNTVEPRVKTIRAFMDAHDINVPHISINEYGGLYDQFAPGIFVQYFAALERAGVISAVKTCWPEEQGGVSNCWTATLQGLVTYPERKPRSTWWAYKGYADVSGQLLTVNRSETVDGVAGFDPADESIRILLGRDAEETSAITLQFERINRRREVLGAFGQIRVAAYRIPNSGKQELGEMILEFDECLSVAGPKATITLPNFGPTDAYLIKVLNPDASM